MKPYPSPSPGTGMPFLKHLFIGLSITLLVVHVQAQTEGFNYNGTWITYSASTVNDPSHPYYDSWVTNHPNSGIYVAEPVNGHYNCHAFAWPNDKSVWVQTYGARNQAPQIYYDSTQAYIQTTEADAEIAVYGSPSNPIHSAVRITNSSNGFGSSALLSYPQYAGWWISKWDGGPLVIHHLDSCPYLLVNQPPVFYKKNHETAGSNNIHGSAFTVGGAKVVCASGSQFTLTCGTPVSFTVSWSGSSNITFPSGTVYPCTATANGSGPGYVQATLHFPDGTSATTASYPVWVGGPDAITSISASQWSPGPGSSSTIYVSGYAQFYGWPFNTGDLNYPNPIDAHGASSYTWSCPSLSFYQNPATVGYRYAAGSFGFGSGYGSMVLQASNACGSSYYWQSIYVSGSSLMYSLSPNPAGNEVTISIPERSSTAKGERAVTDQAAAPRGLATGAGVTYTVRIIDAAGTVRSTARKTGNTFTLPVNGLKNGTYTLEISDGKTISSKPLVVAH